MNDEMMRSDVMSDIRSAVLLHIELYSQLTKTACGKVTGILNRVWVFLYVLIAIGCVFSFLRSVIGHYGWGDFIPICVAVSVIVLFVGFVCSIISRYVIALITRKHNRMVVILRAFSEEDWFKAIGLMRPAYMNDHFISMYVAIGKLFGLGGVDKSTENAVLMLKRLCGERFWPAFYVLGFIHELGIGIQQDRTIAESLFAEGTHLRMHKSIML